MVLGAVLCAVFTIKNLAADNMPRIKFDVGQNILATAKGSGAPRFSARNVAGLISYKLIDMPADIPAYYARPGFEINASPLFAFTLYADEELHNGLAVEAASLQFNTKSIISHESAKKLVGELISQFQHGKWTRYIDEICPAVTGRSSYLNEAGEPEQIGACALDPQHQMSPQDWITMIGTTQNYKWMGDGILATLTVGFTDDIRGITYSIHLDFDDFAIKKRRADVELARSLAEGDSRGRNMTAKHKAKREARLARLKLLEDNALRRGDAMVPR
jgi:hypothetical protein